MFSLLVKDLKNLVLVVIGGVAIVVTLYYPALVAGIEFG